MKPHGVKPQDNIIIILTALRTSDLVQHEFKLIAWLMQTKASSKRCKVITFEKLSELNEVSFLYSFKLLMNSIILRVSDKISETFFYKT
jgi:hypothetical protein